MVCVFLCSGFDKKKEISVSKNGLISYNGNLVDSISTDKYEKFKLYLDNQDKVFLFAKSKATSQFQIDIYSGVIKNDIWSVLNYRGNISLSIDADYRDFVIIRFLGIQKKIFVESELSYLVRTLKTDRIFDGFWVNKNFFYCIGDAYPYIKFDLITMSPYQNENLIDEDFVVSRFADGNNEYVFTQKRLKSDFFENQIEQEPKLTKLISLNDSNLRDSIIWEREIPFVYRPIKMLSKDQLLYYTEIEGSKDFFVLNFNSGESSILCKSCEDYYLVGDI